MFSPQQKKNKKKQTPHNTTYFIWNAIATFNHLPFVIARSLLASLSRNTDAHISFQNYFVWVVCFFYCRDLEAESRLFCPMPADLNEIRVEVLTILF